METKKVAQVDKNGNYLGIKIIEVGYSYPNTVEEIPKNNGSNAKWNGKKWEYTMVYKPGRYEEKVDGKWVTRELTDEELKYETSRVRQLLNDKTNEINTEILEEHLGQGKGTELQLRRYEIKYNSAKDTDEENRDENEKKIIEDWDTLYPLIEERSIALDNWRSGLDDMLDENKWEEVEKLVEDGVDVEKLVEDGDDS